MNKFEVGDIITLDRTNIFATGYVAETWDRCGLKDRATVTVVRPENYYIRIDNDEFNAIGGSWNPKPFRLVRKRSVISIDEELFDL